MYVAENPSATAERNVGGAGPLCTPPSVVEALFGLPSLENCRNAVQAKALTQSAKREIKKATEANQVSARLSQSSIPPHFSSNRNDTLRSAYSIITSGPRKRLSFRVCSAIIRE